MNADALLRIIKADPEMHGEFLRLARGAIAEAPGAKGPARNGIASRFGHTIRRNYERLLGCPVLKPRRNTQDALNAHRQAVLDQIVKDSIGSLDFDWESIAESLITEAMAADAVS